MDLSTRTVYFAGYDEVVTLGRPGREMIAAWHRGKTEQSDWERRMGRSVWGCWQGVFSTAVLYGSLALFTSILHNVFLLYYVQTFVSIYKIDKISFWVGEVSDKRPVPVAVSVEHVIKILTHSPGLKCRTNVPGQCCCVPAVVFKAVCQSW